jgi:hypothetical protein
MRPYRITHTIQLHLDKIIEEKLKVKAIVPSTSPYGAGNVMVKKRAEDGTVKFRATFDFRALNAKTFGTLATITHF